MIILYAVFLFKILHQLLYAIYFFQLKEYRLDRIMETLTRMKRNPLELFLHFSLLAPISKNKLPRPTGKVFVLFLITCLLLFPFVVTQNLYVYFIVLLLTPFFVSVALLFIQPFEALARQSIYKAAEYKVIQYQKKHHLVVIGITGSYGKSTTKHFLSYVLSQKSDVLQTPYSVNTPLGVSLVILRQLTPQHRFLIVEMGAYKTGEISELCRICHPTIGIVTGISNQHLSLFGTQTNLIAAKSELLQSLPPDGIAIINKNSLHKPVFVRDSIENIFYYGDKSVLEPYKTQLPKTIPSFLLENLEPVLIIARHFSITEDVLRESIKTLTLPDKTMTRYDKPNNVVVLDDSFNANIIGTQNAISYIKNLPYETKIVIMPCLIELGKNAVSEHEKLGKQIANSVTNCFVTTTDYFADIQRGAGGSSTIVFATDPVKIIDILKTTVKTNAVILLEGKVPETVKNYLLQKIPS